MTIDIKKEIVYDSNGDLLSIGYYYLYIINDYKDYKKIYHNKNGIAFIYFNNNGNIKIKQFCLEGHFHNEKGPASFRNNENNIMWLKDYYLFGKVINVSSNKELKRYIKLLNIK